MKSYIKTIGMGVVAGLTMLSVSSCNDLINKEPITDITPEDYYKTPDQLAAYLNNYYNAHLVQPFNYYSFMTHQYDYTDGLNRSDANTDISCISGGSTTWFANNHWQTATGKSLQTWYSYVRIWNYFLDKAITNYESGNVSGDQALARNYIGEGYFFRALSYFRILAKFGDAPIITEVLGVDDDELVAASVRDPRNEVARFILSDLDKAAEYLYDRTYFNGQRVNKQCAYLLKSRVALFEATFEKYHRGSGRVPGDADWPGAAMSYNQDKTFDIDSEINFFLDECMSAAKEAVGTGSLTTNNKVLQPKVGVTSGWNPYFELYSQPSLSDNTEAILWREYSSGYYNTVHSAPYRSTVGCNDGMTRTFVESFVMTDGLPFYASNLYQGDKTIDNVKANRDYRLQLFLWSESTLKYSDSNFSDYTATGTTMGVPDIINANAENRVITGYMSRKYVTYDYDQAYTNRVATNACPVFRTAEARLNYIEACYERNHTIDATADQYWREIRERAGIEPDYNITIANTDLSQEGEWSVYSGTTQVDATLFNIRRERMCETFNEGLHFADLIRWRSFDRLITDKWIPEGCNFWDEMYEDSKFKDVVADGTSSANVSRKELSKYLRPYATNENANTNELLNGYTWHEAYYLSPLGARDITTASSDRTVETSNMYQNIYWPNEGGQYCLK